MPKTRTENVAINTGASVAMMLVSQLMGFVLKTVFIHTLGKQYTGVSSLFGDILSMLSLAELGIGSAITFSLYKPLRENDHKRIAALMAFYKKAYRLIALIVAVAGMACIPFLPMMIEKAPDIKESLTLIFALFIVDTSSTYLLVYKSTLFTAGQRRYIVSAISVVFSLIRTTVQTVLLFVFKNYILFLVVGIIENLVRNFVISKAADRHYPDVKKYPKERLPKEEVKRLLNDVFALSLYRINSVVVSSTDSIIISSMTSMGYISVGILSAYRLIINTVDSFIGQFFTAVLPSLGSLAVDASPKKQFSVFKMILFTTFWCSCFCITSMLVLSTPFIGSIWLDESFVQPVSIVVALLLDYYIKCMMRPLNNFRSSNGLFIQGKWRPLATTIINIVLSIALARPLGIFGILIATTISRLTTTFWFEPYLVYSRIFQAPVSDYAKRFTLYTLTMLLSCAATVILTSVIRIEHVYWDFLFKMAMCLVVPNGLIILFYRKTEEYRQFMGYVLQIWGRATGWIGRRVRRNTPNNR